MINADVIHKFITQNNEDRKIETEMRASFLEGNTLPTYPSWDTYWGEVCFGHAGSIRFGPAG